MIFDKIGQEIKPGSIIAYGHALGRCAGLRIGKVLEVRLNIKYRIVIWGINDDWHEPPKLLSRKSIIWFSDRVIVLDPQTIKPEFKTLLDNIHVY